MTPTERANGKALDLVEKFWIKNVASIRFKGRPKKSLVDVIAAALTEARAEGFRECQAKSHEVAVRRVVHNPMLDYDAGWNRGAELIASEIKALESND